jgi:nuclear transport factor 2 (NTF2) superfamily protein
LSAHGKAYIREKFDANTYLFKNRKPSVILRNIVKQIKAMSENKIAGYYGPKFKYNSNIVKELIKHYSAFYNKIEVFDNSKIPKQYIIDRKAVARANRSVSTKAKNYWKQNISIGVLKTSWGSYQTTDIDNYKLKDLNTKFKGFSVYSYKGDSRLRSMCSDLPNVTFIEVAPTKMKLLKDLSNFVSLDKFMNEKYKALRNVATVMYIREQIPNLATLYSMKNINRISSRLYNIIKELYEFTSKHGSTVRYEYNISDIEQEIYDFCTEKNAFNEQIKSLYTANEKELIGLDHLRMFVAKRENDLDEITINLATDYVLARKLFRPDVEAVKKLRKETIFNNK